jgi:hypothetical protein
MQTLLEQMKSQFTARAGVPVDRITPTVGMNSARRRARAALTHTPHMRERARGNSHSRCAGPAVAKMEIKSAAVTFWDLGGSAALRPIWEKYYTGAGGVVFVVDSTDETRFPDVAAALGARGCVERRLCFLISFKRARAFLRDNCAVHLPCRNSRECPRARGRADPAGVQQAGPAGALAAAAREFCVAADSRLRAHAIRLSHRYILYLYLYIFETHESGV